MKVTINVVTGILGSGKTSLLRHVLDRDEVEGRWGVVVGEYAQEGFDGPMLENTGARVEQITNTGRGTDAKSYVEPVRDMIEDEAHWRIFLETSGVTQISQLAADLMADPVIAAAIWNSCVRKRASIPSARSPKSCGKRSPRRGRLSLSLRSWRPRSAPARATSTS